MSFGNESAHDSAAKDLRPDLYVMHIIGGTIREPSANDVVDMDASMQNADQTELDTALRRLLTQHQARCGIKTVHTCKILIGELKPLPSRRDAIQSNIALVDGELNGDDAGNSQWADKWYSVFEESIQQLMDDCAVHFLDSPDTKVIAVVSSGPFWHWAEIGKEDLPNYNFLTMEPETDGVDFFERFPDALEDCLLLGSKISDEEVNKMREVMYKLIGSEHPELSPFPSDFNFQLIPDATRDPIFFQ